MAAHKRIDIRKCLWICGAKDANNQRHAAFNVEVLKAGGTEVFLYKGGNDADELKVLRQRLLRDDHVVLFSLKPFEMKELYPLFRDRKNFSLVEDDWWQNHHWFAKEAEYLFFRKYHGIAVRLGILKFINGPTPPLFLNPISPQSSNYLRLCSVLRPAALVASPFLELRNLWRRHAERFSSDRLIYMPFGVKASDVPLFSEKVQYDFTNTSGTLGVWVMRDAYAPARYTFTNLYDDRRQLVEAIASFENNPFTFYDCRREKNYYMPWEDYIRKTQQSRFTVCSGGLLDAGLPKFLEYACMGIPLIGRPVPFEHPWQEDVFVPIDVSTLTRNQLKTKLHDALECYPLMREKCLNLREQLLKRYHYDAILDLAQAQIDGRPIPEEYVRNHSAKIQPANTPNT